MTTETLLAKLFNDIGEQERRVETARQTLAEQSLFDAYSAFNRIDKFRRGFVSITDLNDFLRANNIFPSDVEMRSLFLSWDSDRDGRISQTDFMEAILPASNRTLRTIVTGRSPALQPIPFEVEFAVARVFEHDLNFFRQVDDLKRQLNSKYGFSIHMSYNLIDHLRIGYISQDALRLFMRRYGYYPMTEDIDAILRRTDKNGDGRISFAEFSDALMPTKPMYIVSGFRGLVPDPPRYYSPVRTYIPPMRSTSPIRSSIYRASSPVLSYARTYRAISPERERAASPLRSSSPLRYSPPVRYSYTPAPSLRVYSPIRRSYNYIPRDISPYRRPLSPLRYSVSYYRERSLGPEYYRPYQSAYIPARSTLDAPRQFASPEPRKTNELEEELKASSASAKTPEKASLKASTGSKGDDLRKSLTPEPRSLEASDEEPIEERRCSTPPAKPTEEPVEVEEGALSMADLKTPPKPAQDFKRAEKLEFEEAPKEEDIVNIFMEQIELDKALENAKQDVAICRDFNFIDGFKLFDKNHAGQITISELAGGLEELGMTDIDKAVLYLLFRHYDRDSDGKIRYSDFLEMVTSSRQEYQDLIRQRQPNRGEFSNITLEKLRTLFEAHLKLEQEAENIRQKVKINAHNAFSEIDLFKRSYITEDDIVDVLRNNGKYVSFQNTKGLMERYDRNRDGRITYSEFVQEISPKSPVKLN